MEEQQKIIKEEEEAIIASADTQLLSETTASMEVEESLEVDQDTSGRDPSFNEGNFMSHNLLTSASTPICPSSAMKRLLHLSNDSSEDNRTPPKKRRNETTKPVSARVDDAIIQDGGSAGSQDSWRSHDEGRRHPPDAHHLKGGSFSLDNGTTDAHLKSGSFSLDNGAVCGAAASYDSHQGHIYGTGVSSDRLPEMRRSPTKDQLVHMIENLNKQIAKYENEFTQKIELENPELCTKKLTFAINAVCIVEMKDAKSAHIRCISLCEETHQLPANTNDQVTSSFGHHSSDADRSSSLTTGSGSLASGPGPFEPPLLTHLARLQQSPHSLTSSSSSSNGRQHQGASINQRGMAGTHLKLAPQHLRLTCPRCEYTFANHSRASSTAASPLVGDNEQEKAATLVDRSLLRDISNFATPPTAIKISVLDDSSDVSGQIPASKRSWMDEKRPRRESLKDYILDKNPHCDSGSVTISAKTDHEQNGDAILRQSPKLNEQNDSFKAAESNSSTLIAAVESEAKSVSTADSAIVQCPNVPESPPAPSKQASETHGPPFTPSAKPVATPPDKPSATPTTSWGDKGIGASYLCLDTSSMSTDSEAETYCFPPMLDDPSISSPFLDLESSCLSRLAAADQNFDNQDGGGGGAKCQPDEKNKSRVALSSSSRLRAERTLLAVGPLPPPGSALFSGCGLLFSHCVSHLDRWRALRSSDTEEHSDHDACPMDVHRLTRQVLAGGGQVFRRLHEVPREMRDNLYLIADRPSRSPLFLACLMEGVPLVSYVAVVSACIERVNFKQLVSESPHSVLLPIGWSDETGHRITRKQLQSQQPLQDKRVLYACGASSANQATHEFWRAILARMGAYVVEHKAAEPFPPNVDIVVSDSHVTAAQAQNVPVVNCNWIVHSLLHASYRYHNATPFYSVDQKYCDSS